MLIVAGYILVFSSSYLHCWSLKNNSKNSFWSTLYHIGGILSATSHLHTAPMTSHHSGLIPFHIILVFSSLPHYSGVFISSTSFWWLHPFYVIPVVASPISYRCIHPLNIIPVASSLPTIPMASPLHNIPMASTLPHHSGDIIILHQFKEDIIRID